MMNEASIRPAKQQTIIGVPKPYLRTNPVLPLDANALLFENVPHDDVDDLEDDLLEGTFRRCPGMAMTVSRLAMNWSLLAMNWSLLTLVH